MTVKEITQTDVVTVHEEQSAGNLATVMLEEDVGSVVVVRDGDEPVGIVTDRDLVLHVLEPRLDPREVAVTDVMSADLATVHEDASIFEATSELLTANVRRMPVVDDDGSLTGIVTLDDFVVLFTDELNGLAGVIEAESPKLPA
jgi:CBS domain-containing protein